MEKDLTWQVFSSELIAKQRLVLAPTGGREVYQFTPLLANALDKGLLDKAYS